MIINILNTLKDCFSDFAEQIEIGSIYTNMNTGNIRYPFVNIDPQRAELDLIGTDRFVVYIYWADRLTETASNELECFDGAYKALKTGLRKAADLLGMGDITFNINFFRQRFADETAGAWAEVSLNIDDLNDYCETYD